MALADWERTTDTSTTQFIHFIQFLSENGLLEDALKRLNNKGLDKIRVSVQHIREVQELVRETFQAKGAVSSSADAVILSAHIDGACK